MHNPMPDRDRLEVLRLAQPSSRHGQGGGEHRPPALTYGPRRSNAALKQKNMLDNTLIVFTSDNGAATSALFATALGRPKSAGKAAAWHWARSRRLRTATFAMERLTARRRVRVLAIFPLAGQIVMRANLDLAIRDMLVHSLSARAFANRLGKDSTQRDAIVASARPAARARAAMLLLRRREEW
jgi:hypothetical protein